MTISISAKSAPSLNTEGLLPECVVLSGKTFAKFFLSLASGDAALAKTC